MNDVSLCCSAFVTTLCTSVNIVSSFLKEILTVPCLFSSFGLVILLMTAVVGFGDEGNNFSPKSALEKDDFPALNAPNKAIVIFLCVSFSFCVFKELT